MELEEMKQLKPVDLVGKIVTVWATDGSRMSNDTKFVGLCQELTPHFVRLVYESHGSLHHQVVPMTNVVSVYWKEALKETPAPAKAE